MTADLSPTTEMLECLQKCLPSLEELELIECLSGIRLNCLHASLHSFKTYHLKSTPQRKREKSRKKDDSVQQF